MRKYMGVNKLWGGIHVRRFRDAVVSLPEELTVQILFGLLFSIPLVATIGQFVSSGYLGQFSDIPVVGWPGVGWWRLATPGWLVTLVVVAVYAGGIGWLLYRRT